MVRNAVKISARAKLTYKQIRRVHKLLREGMTQAEIAARVDVSQTTISNILNRKVYRQVA